MSLYQKNDPELRKQAKKPLETVSASINVADEEIDREIFGRVGGSSAQLRKQRTARNGRKQSLRAAVSYFHEYCGSTSLHGLKYMGEEKRPLIERICWLIAFGLSIMACGHLIHKVWKKWENTPVIVSFADSSTPVWQIPFPAVTICSETKYRKTVFNYTDINYKLSKNMNISEEKMRRYEYKSLLCDGDEYLENASWNTSTEAIKFLQQAAPSCEDFFYCTWKGAYADCCEYLFRPILTEEGVCYTFNMLATSQIFTQNMTVDGFNETYDIEDKTESPWTDWNAQDGYPKNATLEAYPKRGPGAGATSGLHIYLRADPNDIDIRCRVIGGFKVLLHNPSEFPRISQQYFRAPLNQDVVVSVKPNIMGTGKELQDYPPSRRRCLFQSERQLRFFTFYTQSNCELECLMNATLRSCHCMPFFMPSFGYPICGAGSLTCVRETSERQQHEEILEAMLSINNVSTSSTGCNCMPACTELNFDAETSMGTFDVERIFAEFNVTEGAYLGKSIGKLSIFFKEWQFITSRRGELYGQTDFLANCGGLLGLCMGFSILSLVEIAYFLTLRLFHNFGMKKSTSKNSIDKELAIDKEC